MTDDSAVGYSGQALIALVGDALEYQVVWEERDGLAPLPERVGVSFGPSETASVGTSEPLREGVQCPPIQLVVVRSFDLSVGGDALVASGTATLAGDADQNLAVTLAAEQVQLADEHRAAAEEYLAQQDPRTRVINTVTLWGLTELSTPEVAFDARWEVQDGEDSGVSVLWRAEAMTRLE